MAAIRSAPLVLGVLALITGCREADLPATPPTAPTASAVSATSDSAHVHDAGAHAHVVAPTASGNSTAMGQWRPGRFDTCTSEIHDRYATVGPDGKRYPTWHPPVDPATGCRFGHEHGRDPRGSALHAEIGDVPFGVANEALLEWQPGGMRHEDHVGHKVEWENNVQLHYSIGGQRVPFDVRCDWLAKLHQGTHSTDALPNNTHEVFYAVRCTDGTRLVATVLSRLDRVGRFERACQKGTFVTTDIPPMPGQTNGRGTRLIPDRTCAERHILVPRGQWSGYGSFYENWSTANYLRTPDGRELAYFDPGFAVFNPARYHDPRVRSRLSYTVDLCYERIGSGSRERRARGGECDWGTQGGALRLTWDDPRSPFRGDKREVYFNQSTLANAGGPTVWYTDPFGGNARTTPFPGSIRQQLAAIDNRRPYPLESQAVGANRAYGGSTVHAPN